MFVDQVKITVKAGKGGDGAQLVYPTLESNTWINLFLMAVLLVVMAVVVAA